MKSVDRRAFLLGTAGLLVSACGGGKGSEPEASKGPNIVKPRTGNVVTPEETAALAQQLNAATEARDLDQLIGLIDPEDFSLDDVRQRWGRRFENWDRMGVVSGTWYVGSPAGRTRNAAGGKVEFAGDLVFAHEIKGCDAQGVVEAFRADFRKEDEKAPLELMRIGDAEALFDPSFWDVADVDAIETGHAVIGFRTSDAQRAKDFRGRIEAGAQQAFAAMPHPEGVSKIFYALTWPEIDGKLWGGVSVGEADAHAYYHPFLDPAELAKGQQTAAPKKGGPLATGRAGLHQAAFRRSDFTSVAAHEGVHVLAEQWRIKGGAAPTWSIEGLAMWGQEGARALLGRDGGRIRGFFSTFQDKGLKGSEDFYNGADEYQMYACAGAVYSYLEAEKGKDAVYEAASAFYSGTNREDGAKAVGFSEKELFAATRRWLGI